MNSVIAATVFLKRKRDKTIVIPIWIKGLNNKYGFVVNRISLDNSGENKRLPKGMRQTESGNNFEFTAPGTPQQNSVAERKIRALIGRARAMMIQAGFNQQEKSIFWCEVISTVKKLDNIMVRTDGTKPPQTLLFNKDANLQETFMNNR